MRMEEKTIDLYLVIKCNQRLLEFPSQSYINQKIFISIGQDPCHLCTPFNQTPNSLSKCHPPTSSLEISLQSKLLWKPFSSFYYLLYCFYNLFQKKERIKTKIISVRLQKKRPHHFHTPLTFVTFTRAPPTKVPPPVL